MDFSFSVCYFHHSQQSVEDEVTTNNQGEQQISEVPLPLAYTGNLYTDGNTFIMLDRKRKCCMRYEEWEKKDINDR